MSLTKSQIAMRRTGLTAGDMRAIVGEDPYGRTAHDVYLHKLGIEPQVETTEPMEWGNALEPLILARIATHAGLRLIDTDPESLTTRHAEHAHHIATPDGLLVPAGGTVMSEPVALAEAKAVGLRAMDGWGESGTDEIPDWCLVQVTWQMHVRQVPVVHVGALLGLETRHYTITMDEDLEGVLVEAADQFYVDHVIPKSPPAVDGSRGSARMLKAIWPRHRAESGLKAGPQAEDLVREYMQAKAAGKAADERAELAKQQLVELLCDFETMIGDGWRLRYSYREPAEVAAYTRAGYRAFDLRPTKGRKT